MRADCQAHDTRTTTEVARSTQVTPMSTSVADLFRWINSDETKGDWLTIVPERFYCLPESRKFSCVATSMWRARGFSHLIGARPLHEKTVSGQHHYTLLQFSPLDGNRMQETCGGIYQVKTNLHFRKGQQIVFTSTDALAALRTFNKSVCKVLDRLKLKRRITEGRRILAVFCHVN